MGHKARFTLNDRPASAYIASAVRGAIHREETQRALDAAGITVTPEGVAAMRERYEAGKRKLANAPAGRRPAGA